MKIFKLLFSFNWTINRKQYFFTYLGFSFLTAIFIGIFAYYTNLELKDLLLENNINKTILLNIFIWVLLFYPTTVIDYKRIKDTNLNIFIFYILIFFSFLALAYFLLSYFKIITYNDVIKRIILWIWFMLNLPLFFAWSKNNVNNENSLDDIIISINNNELKFFPVKNTKFILLSLSTFWIYNFYWFYNNFKYVKLNFEDSKNIWPFARALFSPITSYYLFKKIFYWVKKDYSWVIASLYFFLIALWNNPNYILTTVWLFVWLSLLPVVNHINEINNYKENEILKSSKSYNFNKTTIVILMFLTPIFIYIFLASSYILPSWNIKWNDLWFWQRSFLENITNWDKINYFYTNEFLNMKKSWSIVWEKAVYIYSDSNIIQKIDYLNIKSIKEENTLFIKEILLYPKDVNINPLYLSLDSWYNYNYIYKYIKWKIK